MSSSVTSRTSIPDRNDPGDIAYHIYLEVKRSADSIERLEQKVSQLQSTVDTLVASATGFYATFSSALDVVVSLFTLLCITVGLYTNKDFIVGKTKQLIHYIRTRISGGNVSGIDLGLDPRIAETMADISVGLRVPSRDSVIQIDTDSDECQTRGASSTHATDSDAEGEILLTHRSGYSFRGSLLRPKRH